MIKIVIRAILHKNVVSSARRGLSVRARVIRSDRSIKHHPHLLKISNARNR